MKKNIIIGIVLGVIVILIVGFFILSGRDRESNSENQNPKSDNILENLGVTDCGTPKGMPGTVGSEDFNPETDSALVCLGNAMLNCKSAISQIGAEEPGPLYLGVEKINNKCFIRLQYGDESEFEDESKKKYADKYMLCPLDIDALNEKTNVEVDFTQFPGGLAAGIYFLSAFEVFNSETKCTGDIFDLIDSNFKFNIVS